MSVQLSKSRSRAAAGIILGLGLAIAVGIQVAAPSVLTDTSAAVERTVEQDRQLLKDFGFARNALTAETAAELPDLYSSSLTADPSYSWNSEDYALRISPDRIVPLNQIVRLGGEDWPIEKKQAFGADIENMSPTSHAANSWKGLKTPEDLLADTKAGSFSWSDPCADVYKNIAVLTPVGGCEGAPEDFDSCGYAERYSEIAARYELAIPAEDRYALAALLADCPSS